MTRSPRSPLTGLATQALTALDARTKAKAERAVASNDVDEWKEGVNTLRLSTYAELLKLVADKAYGKAWVEAFFRVDSASGPGEDAAEPSHATGDASAGSALADAHGGPSPPRAGVHPSRSPSEPLQTRIGPW